MSPNQIKEPGIAGLFYVLGCTNVVEARDGRERRLGDKDEKLRSFPRSTREYRPGSNKAIYGFPRTTPRMEEVELRREQQSRTMQDDYRDVIGRVASGTKTEQLSRVKQEARTESMGTRNTRRVSKI